MLNHPLAVVAPLVALAAVLVPLLAEPPSISFPSWMLMPLLPVELKMTLQELALELGEPVGQQDVHFVYLVAYRSSGFSPTQIRLDPPEVQACPTLLLTEWYCSRLGLATAPLLSTAVD